MKVSLRFAIGWACALAAIAAGAHVAVGATVIFFSSAQSTNLVATNATSDTFQTEEYLFTYTRDKLFTGGVGLTNPIGRTVRVAWPQGLEAQAVTAGPAPGSARFDIQRVDRQPFAIPSFKARLLANTAGAGADLEVMPLLNGEDGFPDPLKCPASGYYGSEFTYNTPTLTGFDAYKITLYVDFALMSMTIVDASVPRPALSVVPAGPGWVELSWPAEAVGYALESTPNLPASVWSSVTNEVVLSGDVFTVQVESGEAARLYRLRK